MEFEEEKEIKDPFKSDLSPPKNEADSVNSVENIQSPLSPNRAIKWWSKGVLESSKKSHRRHSDRPFANEATGKNVEANYLKKMLDPFFAHQSLESENMDSWKDSSPRKNNVSERSENSEIENAEITATQIELLSRPIDYSKDYIEQPSMDNPNELQILDTSMHGLNAPL